MAWWDSLGLLAVVAFFGWLVANLLAIGIALVWKASSVPTDRAHLWRLAALPWIFPLLAIASLLLLSVAKSKNWILHHCLVHQPHHPHFCLEHLPQINLTLAQSVVVMTIASVALIALFFRLKQQVDSLVRSRTLCRLFPDRLRKNTLAELQPLAFTTGIVRPVIVVSQGLVNTLSKHQQRIVVRHEIAHIRHQDVLKNTVFEVLLCLHIYPQLLRSRWYLSAEMRADDWVRRRYDPLDIADVLLSLCRLGVNSPYPVSIVGSVIAERVERLLAPVEPRVNHWPADIALYLAVVAFPVALIAGHHGLETVWGWLL